MMVGRKPVKLVIDTNVLVSGTLTPEGKPGQLLLAMVYKKFTPIITPAIFAEYHEVMYRVKFGFDPAIVGTLLETIFSQGLMLFPPVSTIPLIDPKDRPFLDVALYAACPIVTGNGKHFPASTGVKTLSPAEALASLQTA